MVLRFSQAVFVSILVCFRTVALAWIDLCSQLGAWRLRAPSCYQKVGAGAYSWGSPTDVQDFEPAGVDVNKVGVQTVSPVVHVVQQAPAVVYKHDDAGFPALGSSEVTRVAAANWGSAATVYAAAPTSVSVQPAPCVVRSIGTEFGQSHPRNQFATLPTKTVASTVIQAPAVDWSASGGLPVASQLIRAGGGAAHISPLAVESKPVQQVPLTVLRAQVAHAPVYAPTVARPVMNAPKPIIQPRR